MTQFFEKKKYFRMESFHSVKKKCVIVYGCEMVCLLFYVDCDANKMSYSILLFIFYSYLNKKNW